MIFVPHFATISLVPDSKGHKPKRYENNSCGVIQQHNKLLPNGPVMSIKVHKLLVRISLNYRPLTKAIM